MIDFPSIRTGYKSVLAHLAGFGPDLTMVCQGIEQNLCQSVGSLFPPGLGAGRGGPGAFCTRVKEGKHSVVKRLMWGRGHGAGGVATAPPVLPPERLLRNRLARQALNLKALIQIGDDHPGAARVPAQAVGEHLGGLRFAVHHKDRRWRPLQGLHPVQQHRLVGVAAEAV